MVRILPRFLTTPANPDQAGDRILSTQPSRSLEDFDKPVILTPGSPLVAGGGVESDRGDRGHGGLVLLG
jgi:hypothetical protein